MYSDGHHLLYQQFPEKYVLIEKQKVWQKRKQGFAIGRMYHCNPLQGERFYLRLLLTVVAGAKSFSHLRTVNGIVYDRYQEACVAMLRTAAKGRLWLQSGIVYYKSTKYGVRQVVAQGAKRKRRNKQKYMNRIVCLAKLSLR